jgi:hypothetical protein
LPLSIVSESLSGHAFVCSIPTAATALVNRSASRWRRAADAALLKAPAREAHIHLRKPKGQHASQPAVRGLNAADFFAQQIDGR